MLIVRQICNISNACNYAIQSSFMPKQNTLFGSRIIGNWSHQPNGSALFPVNFTQISVYSVFKSFILLFALPFVIVKGVQNIIHSI